MAQEGISAHHPPDLKNYNWLGVLAFIQDQSASFELEKTKWMIEKRALTEQVAEAGGGGEGE